MIRYLKHKEINKIRWDACMDAAPNGRLDAYSWWLDAVSPNWEALILDDYRAVFPLPVKRKFGIPYLSQPPFTQQLGIFTGEAITPDLVDDFLKHIPRKFIKIDMNMNIACGNVFSGFKTKLCTTQALSLNTNAEQLHRTIEKGDLKRIQKQQLEVSDAITLQEAVDIASNHLPKYVSSEYLNPFQKMFEICAEKQVAEFSGVRNPQGEWYAGAMFVNIHGRISIFSGTSPNGRNSGAKRLLIDAIFQKYAGQNLIFDFRGSNIPGVAQFNHSFGAKDEHYWNIVRP